MNHHVSNRLCCIIDKAAARLFTLTGASREQTKDRKIAVSEVILDIIMLSLKQSRVQHTKQDVEKAVSWSLKNMSRVKPPAKRQCGNANRIVDSNSESE